MSTDDSAPDLLTQKQYAKRRGWSKQYVNQLVKKGRIRLQGGLIDVRSADAALGRTRDPSRDAAFRTDGMNQATLASADEEGAARVHGSFARARTVREHYRAMREKLEFEISRGQWLDRQEVEAEYFTIARRWRQHMLIAATDIGQALVSEFGENRRMREIVEAGIRRALEEFTQELEGEADGDPEPEEEEAHHQGEVEG